MANPLRVLIVDDSEKDALLLMRELKQGGYEPTYEQVKTLKAMKAALEKKAWDVVIANFQMAKFTGLDVLKVLEEKEGLCPASGCHLASRRACPDTHTHPGQPLPGHPR